MSDEIDDLLGSFIVQSNELMDGSDVSLGLVLDLVRSQSEIDSEHYNSIFRTFHTIKGVAGFLNLNVIVKVAHKGEYILDELRKGDVFADVATIELLIKTSDFMRTIFNEIESTSSDDSLAEESLEVIAELDNCLNRLKNGDEKPGEINKSVTNANAKVEVFEKPSDDFAIEITDEILNKFLQECNDLLDDSEQVIVQFAKGVKGPEQIAQLYRNIHSFKGNCGFVGFSGMEKYSHRFESVLDLLRESKLVLSDDAQLLFFECLDVLRNSLKNIAEGSSELDCTKEDSYEKMEIYLVEEEPQAPDSKIVDNKVSSKEKDPIKKGVKEELVKKDTSEVFKDFPVVSEKKNESPVAANENDALSDINEQIKNAKAPVESKKVELQQAIRVDMQKLDYLQNMVGELIIAKEMVAHNPDLQGMELPELNRSIERLSRITNELQDISMSVRMVPISTVFNKMNRLVRDLTRKSGKSIRTEIEGDETEVDKLVLDLISDPLVHIIRNAGDHGVEMPDVRQATGKPREGCIRLRAEQTTSDLVVEIQDDGKGLARDVILRKGIEKGLVLGDGENLSDSEIFQLIFEPGFSTAEKVTDISGRGVGMDVVKKNIEKAKGKIDILSKQGAGTTFTIRIPLTLATVEVMLVKVGVSTYSIPISRIQEAFKPSEEQVFQRPDGEYFVKLRDSVYQVIQLHKIYEIPSKLEKIEDGILLLLEVNSQKVCILVDDILYQVQTVVKNLSSYMKSVKTISGCNILGTGEVSLIINLEELIKSINKVKVGAV